MGNPRHWPQGKEAKCNIPGCEVTDAADLSYYLPGMRCSAHRPVVEPMGKYTPNRFSTGSRRKSSSSRTKEVHSHGCTECKQRFEDNCQQPKQNFLCSFCETGNGWTLLREGRSPKDCCRVFSRLATKDEIKSYNMAGDKPWFICTECSRHQIFNPVHQ